MEAISFFTKKKIKRTAGKGLTNLPERWVAIHENTKLFFLDNLANLVRFVGYDTYFDSFSRAFGFGNFGKNLSAIL